MSENSQRVKTRNCKRLWRKSIKRILKREITGYFSGSGPLQVGLECKFFLGSWANNFISAVTELS
jgi:hypothetical protein